MTKNLKHPTVVAALITGLFVIIAALIQRPPTPQPVAPPSNIPQEGDSQDHQADVFEGKPNGGESTPEGSPTDGPTPEQPGGTAEDQGQSVVQRPFNGEWRLQISGRFSVDSSGQKRPGSAQAEVSVNFSQEGNYVKGEYLWAQNACPKATVLGDIKGDDFELTIHHKGSCCGGAKTTFTGSLMSPIEIKGEFKPGGPAPSGCTLWWADILGVKGG